jgi:hypothetical protein
VPGIPGPPIDRWLVTGGKPELDGRWISRATIEKCAPGLDTGQGKQLPIYADDLTATWWYTFAGRRLVFDRKEEGVPDHVRELARRTIDAAPVAFERPEILLP